MADESPCIEWQGKRDRDGYGKVWVPSDRAWRLAHRRVYAAVSGIEPGPLCVLHHCDNPSCVNPAHLFLGTRADNVRDMDGKGRANRIGPTSMRSARRKLSPAAVRVIRQRRAAGATMSVLAADFGVTRQSIAAVVHRQTWKSVA
jgi:HNH endonuclease